MSVPRTYRRTTIHRTVKVSGKKRDTLPEKFFQLFHFGIISFGRLIDGHGDSRRFL